MINERVTNAGGRVADTQTIMTTWEVTRVWRVRTVTADDALTATEGCEPDFTHARVTGEWERTGYTHGTHTTSTKSVEEPT